MNNLSGKARVTEIEGLNDALLQCYKSEVGLANDAFLKMHFEQLEELAKELTEAIKRGKAQTTLDAKDAVRDEAVRNLGDMLIGYAAFPMQDKKEAALALKVIFDKYGKQIATESYLNETGFINSLLMDLETKEAKAYIAKLDGVETVVASIRSAQADFSVAYAEWLDIQTNEKAATNATNAKKPVVALINDKLVPYLTAMAAMPGYTHFASLFEEAIGKVNSAVSSRSSKEEKA